MPLIVRYVIAPGFADDPEKFDLTVGAGHHHVPLSDVHVAGAR